VPGISIDLMDASLPTHAGNDVELFRITLQIRLHGLVGGKDGGMGFMREITEGCH
jgi:hypothetical protein